MLFPTIDFAVFFALVFPVTWYLNRWNYPKKLWLVAASYIFYAFWSPWLLGLLFFSAVTNFLIGLALGPVDRRQLARAVVELLFIAVLSFMFISLALLFWGNWTYVGMTWATVAQSSLEIVTNARFLIAVAIIVAGSVALGFWFGRTSGAWRRPAVMAFAVAANLGVLGFFKYYNFLSITLSNLSSHFGVSVDMGSTEVALPIAISFLTFHGLSYVIDVHRGRIAPSTSIVDLLLYISFFPHLVAGPIVRAHDFLPQLQRPSDPSTIRIGPSVFLIVGGLFKKVVIASHVSTLFVDPIFVEPTNYGTLDLILGMYAYAVVIYCDFSAYTDIAIGIANLLGYQFPQNFDQPYRSLSLQEFWRRWHITLSTWLRDYLYISLGGNRKGTFNTYRNLILTMVLGGLWHGAGLQFVVWGLMHGVGLAGERALGLGQAKPGSRFAVARRILAWFVTFQFVCIAWVFFRSPSLEAAVAYFRTLFANPPVVPTITWFVAVWIVLGFLTQWVDAKHFRRLQMRYEAWPLAAQVLAPFVVIYVIAVLAPAGIPPFIYFQF